MIDNLMANRIICLQLSVNTNFDKEIIENLTEPEIKSSKCLTKMKYYVLEVVILFGICEADKYPIIICETDSFLMVYCYTDSKSSNNFPTLPIDTIPLESQVIYLHLSYNKARWQIDNHTMFHRFKNLQELRLDGPVRFSNTYEDQTMRSKLTNELFNLPNLTILALQKWKFNDSYNWKFPRNLTCVQLTKCDYKQFDLTSYPNLVQINFKWNKLQKMPLLSSPPPPLRALFLSNNPGIEFSVYDIVGLCNLKSLSINTFNARFDQTRKYCECKRLQEYMAEFRISVYDSYRCNKSAVTVDCKDYSLEEAMKTHAKECPRSSGYFDVPEPEEKSWLKENFNLIIVCLTLAIIALIFFTVSIILLLNTDIFKPSRSKRKMFRTKN